MTEIVNPHLKYPFEWGKNGSAKTIEQDSPEDIMQCVFAILNTRLGARLDLPEFGVRSFLFQEGGPSLEEMEAAILEWEPRAHGRLTKQNLEDLKSYLVNVGVEVNTDAQ